MPARLLTLGLALTLFLGGIGSVVGAAASEAADTTGVDRPARSGPTTYLALGDSLAAGTQPIGDASDPGLRTRAGYPDQLWLLARQWHPELRLVNLGCPGATTRTMTRAVPTCPYPRGSQLDEALAIIEEESDRLAFITIDIGFNDFPCTDRLSCLEPGLESIRRNLPIILTALREAAPDTPIVAMTVYDPYLHRWLDGEELVARFSVSIVRTLNATLEEVYAGAGIGFADVEGAFATDDFETLVPLAGHGLVPRNVALVCLWTWLCFPPPLGPDRHPNVLGHRVIAEAFAAELDLLPETLPPAPG